MADSTCLLRGLSYASAIPNESKQAVDMIQGSKQHTGLKSSSSHGNPMHVLGESISFGRFMTESLSWDKWSTFSPHKKYVEEAQRYAQPGSVAQKKAFFEAHYKKIAEQKAAALLEQETAAKSAQEEASVEVSDVNVCDQQIVDSSSCLDTVAKSDMAESGDVKITDEISFLEICSDEKNGVLVADEALQESPVKSTNSNNLDNIESNSASESSESQQMERPLLKYTVVKEDAPSPVTSKKRSSFSSLRSSIQRKTWKVPSTPFNPVAPHSKKEPERKSSVDLTDNKKRSSPKSLLSLINVLPAKDPDKGLVSSNKKTQTSELIRGSYKIPPRDHHPTPLRTPLVADSKISSKYGAATPQSENRRLQTPVNPSAPGGKTGPKRHIFSAIYSKSLSACRNKLQSPTLSSPFILRTEERAAKRKQKLEEKFNASEVQKLAAVQQQKTLKDKAGDELRKLGCGFCFKARPLPNFYKEREPPKSHLKKIEAIPSQQPPLPVRSILNKTKGNASMPLPPPPPTKNSASKNLLPKKKKVVAKPVTTFKSVAISLDERIARENASPNIQLR